MALYVLMAYGAVFAILVGGYGTIVRNGFYNAIMQKGATKSSFLISHYFNSVVIFLVPTGMIIAILYLSVGPVPFYPLLLVYCFVEPLFMIVVTYFIVVRLQLPSAVVSGIHFGSAVTVWMTSQLMLNIASSNRSITLYNVSRYIAFPVPIWNMFTGFIMLMIYQPLTVKTHPELKIDDPVLTPYGSYGAGPNFIALIINGGLCLIAFILILLGVCDVKRPQVEGLQPDEPENEDKLVKQEKDRLRKVIAEESTEDVL